jgi:hypothetical protein
MRMMPEVVVGWGKPNLWRWFCENWTHRLIVSGAFLLTVSVIVQIVATVYLGRL